MKVEFYGSKQKKICFGCGSMISFNNKDIQEVDNKSFIECPVCGKRIKAYKLNREKLQSKKETLVGRKIKEAMKEKEEEDFTW